MKKQIETIETAEEYYNPEAEGGCSATPCSVHGDPGLRLWLDRGCDRKTGGWRLRMPAGEEEPDTDEEGNVWISQEVIDVIISSQNAEVSHDAERRCDH
jgi:hypothetical protein